MSNPIVYFDIAIGRLNNPAGRITIEVPEGIRMKLGTKGNGIIYTEEYFRALCTGEKGFGYKGTVFNRIVSSILCQGGDITNQNGKGGKNIYGKKITDEKFELKHDGPGTVSMASKVPNSNGSQFFICFGKCVDFDGKYLVVGKVIDGIPVLKKIEENGSPSGRMATVITITDCGQLQ